VPLPPYQAGQAAEYCHAKGWEAQRTGDELILKTCPYCGKVGKFSLNNLTGAFQCFSAGCMKQGHYFGLLRDQGDSVQSGPRSDYQAPVIRKAWPLSDFVKFEQALLANDAAMRYLQVERGLTLDTIKKWHLGLKTETPDQHKQEDVDGPIDWLMIPYITKKGDIANCKYRSLPPSPKRFKRLPGGESILFGEHLLPDKKIGRA